MVGNALMNNLLLPFEKRTVKCNLDIDSVFITLSSLCIKPQKVLRCYKINHGLVYKTYPGLIFNTQHYILKKTKDNILEIYSRCNTLWAFLYIICISISIILFGYSVYDNWNLTDKIIVLFTGLFFYILGNGIPKILRCTQIDNMLILIEKENHLTTAST